jgi:dihydropteroate synthase
MGILNVTPDSFSDGGRWIAASAAIEHAHQLAADGADIVDIGGESTRPGALPVEPDEQLRRVLPVIQQLAGRLPVPMSIDTSSSLVAREALDAGAHVLNDVTALTGDPEMPQVCAARACGVIIMHMQGTPQTMQLEPKYDDVVREVTGYLSQRVQDLVTRGIAAERIMIDPGIGFGKTPSHNLKLLSSIAALRSTGRPVLIGHSRKRFLQKVLGRPIEEAMAGTIGVAIAVAEQGAELVRVHDVRAVKDALLAWQAVRAASTGDNSPGADQ